MHSQKAYENTSVTAFIPWQGKLLIALRALDDDYLPGHWEQVGGSVDEGETKEEALVREVQEESGLIIKPGKLYYEEEYIYRKTGNPRCEYAFVCALVGEPNVVISPEHQEYRWISLDELDSIQPMSDYMRRVIRAGFEQLKEGEWEEVIDFTKIKKGGVAIDDVLSRI